MRLLTPERYQEILHSHRREYFAYDRLSHIVADINAYCAGPTVSTLPPLHPLLCPHCGDTFETPDQLDSHARTCPVNPQTERNAEGK